MGPTDPESSQCVRDYLLELGQREVIMPLQSLRDTPEETVKSVVGVPHDKKEEQS